MLVKAQILMEEFIKKSLIYLGHVLARDRDRIFHSRCFRRLEYKTQVFVNGIADHFLELDLLIQWK